MKNKLTIIKEKFEKFGRSILNFIQKYIIRFETLHLVLFNKLKIKLTNKRRDAVFGYLFISLWLFGFILLTAYPLIASLIYSLNIVRVNPIEGLRMNFIGFNNYIQVLTTDLTFMTAITDFLLMLIVYIPVIIVISIMIATLLNQKIKFRGLFRAIFFLPVIITSGPVISELLQQGAGTVSIIERMGLLETIESSLPYFIAAPLTRVFSEIIILLWFSGVQIVLFLAGLQKIDKEIYEAAAIDGASPWEIFWKITIPSLKSIILVSAVYTIIMLATFSNNPIITHLKDMMFERNGQGGFGYASAMAWIFNLIVAIILALTSLLILRPKRKVKEVTKKWRNPYVGQYYQQDKNK